MTNFCVQNYDLDDFFDVIQRIRTQQGMFGSPNDEEVVNTLKCVKTEFYSALANDLESAVEKLLLQMQDKTKKPARRRRKSNLQRTYLVIVCNANALSLDKIDALMQRLINAFDDSEDDTTHCFNVYNDESVSHYALYFFVGKDG